MYWFEYEGLIIGSPTWAGAQEAAIRFGQSPQVIKEGKVFEFTQASQLGRNRETEHEA